MYNPQKMKNCWYRQYMLVSSQQICYFQIKWPRKTDEEVDFLSASKGAELHRPTLIEMVHFWMVAGGARGQNWHRVNARKYLGHSGGHSGPLEIHEGYTQSKSQTARARVPLLPLTAWPWPSFLISFSSVKWWYWYHLPHTLLRR